MQDQNISKEEAIELKKITYTAIKTYLTKDTAITDKEWLQNYFNTNLIEHTIEEREELVENLIIEVERLETNRVNIKKYNDNGLSSSQYISSKDSGCEEFLSNQGNVEYLDSLNTIIENSNNSVINKVTTQSGDINMNPNLDGFLAEYEHVNNFNIQSATNGSGNIEAKVLEPEPGKTYAKNSMDVGIYENNKLVQRYQMKFGKDSEATIRMISDGNYSNQRLVVPDEQLEDVKKAFPNKTVISEIEYKNIKSSPLSKSEVKKLQNKIQNGDLSTVQKSWSDINKKKLMISLSKNTAQASILGVGLSFSTSFISSIFTDEEIETEEVIKRAIESGTTSGINTAVTGALTVAIKTNKITFIPQNTSITTIANISHIAIENIKILYRVGKGDLSISDGINKIGENTISTLGGISSALTIGAWVGTLALTGPALIAASIIGQTVAYTAGKNVVSAVYKGVTSVVKSVVKTVWNGVTTVASKVWNTVGTVFSTLSFGLIGW